VGVVAVGPPAEPRYACIYVTKYHHIILIAKQANQRIKVINQADRARLNLKQDTYYSIGGRGVNFMDVWVNGFPSSNCHPTMTPE